MEYRPQTRLLTRGLGIGRTRVEAIEVVAKKRLTRQPVLFCRRSEGVPHGIQTGKPTPRARPWDILGTGEGY